MRLKLTLFTLLFCVSALVFAQNEKPSVLANETIESEMRRCRELLFSALVTCDWNTANQLIDYSIANYEKGMQSCFSLDEYRLIYLVLGREADFVATFSPDNNLARPRPSVETETSKTFLRSLYFTKANQLDYSVYSRLTAEDHDFICLFLHHLRLNSIGGSNAECNQFLRQYPSSKYADYIQNSIFSNARAYGKFGFSTSAGLGMRQHTGSLSDIRRNSFAFSLSARLTYRRFVLDFLADGSIMRTKKDLQKNGLILPRDKTISATALDMGLGYKILIPQAHYNIGKLYLLPTAGVSMTEFAYSDTDVEESKLYSDFAFFTSPRPYGSLELGFETGIIESAFTFGKENYYYFDYGIRLTSRSVKAEFDKKQKYSGLSNTISVFVAVGFSRVSHDGKLKY